MIASTAFKHLVCSLRMVLKKSFQKSFFETTFWECIALRLFSWYRETRVRIYRFCFTSSPTPRIDSRRATTEQQLCREDIFSFSSRGPRHSFVEAMPKLSYTFYYFYFHFPCQLISDEAIMRRDANFTRKTNQANTHVLRTVTLFFTISFLQVFRRTQIRHIFYFFINSTMNYIIHRCDQIFGSVNISHDF